MRKSAGYSWRGEYCLAMYPCAQSPPGTSTGSGFFDNSLPAGVSFHTTGVFQMTATTDELLAEGCVTVSRAVAEYGVGRSRLYEMMSRGESPYSQLGGKKVASTAIITTTPNELVGQVHDRMPVILPARTTRSGSTRTRRKRG
jgi:hypothetical protein